MWHMADDIEAPKGQEFEIEFGSPVFSLRVGGRSRQECEETFFMIYKKVTKGVMGKKVESGMMHR